MVEILDETPALTDPLFLEIWDKINLKKQLEEAHRQLSIAISMPDTVQKTYLVLIDNYRKELEEWFLEEPDESYYQNLYKELEQINVEIQNCKDALQSIELYKKFEEVFNKIIADSELEQSYAKHWDGLERRTRELVRILTNFLLEGSEKMLEMNKEIKNCEENYEALRFGIVRAAEEQIAEKMTKRYQKMRLDVIKEICRCIQEKHDEVFKRQVKMFTDQVNTRKDARKHVNELKSNLRKLRIQYYTEPIEMERNLTQFRDQVLENDQKIALLKSELSHLSEEVKKIDPVSSLKPEVSARQTPIYDIPEDNKSKKDASKAEELQKLQEILSKINPDQWNEVDEAPENEILMFDVQKSNP